MSPIIRLALPLLTPPPHRLCPPPSRPRLSITPSLGPSQLSTPLSHSPLARLWQLTRSSLSCVMARLSTVRRPMLTCSVLRSTLVRQTSTASSTTLPPWCPPSGVTFARTVVSYFYRTGWAISPGSLLWINPHSTDPTRYSIIHDIYQHPGSAAEPSNLPENGYLILSVEYQFTYPESPYSSPQLSPIDSLSSNNSSLPSPSSYNVSHPHYIPQLARLTAVCQYEYTTAGYSPLSRHERPYPTQSNVMVPSDMCYPDTHLPGSYGQVYDESPLLLSAVDGNKGLCATQSSQSQLPMPTGYLNHYVGLHS